jgi:hypothetical protein
VKKRSLGYLQLIAFQRRGRKHQHHLSKENSKQTQTNTIKALFFACVERGSCLFWFF